MAIKNSNSLSAPPLGSPVEGMLETRASGGAIDVRGGVLATAAATSTGGSAGESVEVGSVSKMAARWFACTTAGWEGSAAAAGGSDRGGLADSGVVGVLVGLAAVATGVGVAEGTEVLLGWVSVVVLVGGAVGVLVGAGVLVGGAVGVLVGAGVLVGGAVGVLVGAGVLVGGAVGVLVGTVVSVGGDVGVLVGSGVLVRA